MKRRRRGSGARAGDIVRILSPQPRFIIAGQTQLIFQLASEVPGRAGLHLEIEYHPGLWKLRRPDSTLRKITSQPDTAGWLLEPRMHANCFGRIRTIFPIRVN